MPGNLLRRRIIHRIPALRTNKIPLACPRVFCWCGGVEMRYTKVSMVLKKTKNTAKTRSKKTITTARVRTSPWRRFNSWLVRTNARLTRRYQGFLDRRPHRSFQLTRRRDYVRSLRLPGYISFTLFVWRTLQRHRRTFLLLVLLYGFSMMALGGITNQQAYSQISELLQDAGPDVFTGGAGTLGEAGLLFLSIACPNARFVVDPKPGPKNKRIPLDADLAAPLRVLPVLAAASGQFCRSLSGRGRTLRATPLQKNQFAAPPPCCFCCVGVVACCFYCVVLALLFLLCEY